MGKSPLDWPSGLGEEEQYEDSLGSEEGGMHEERKVRVRTLISEEQQLVLKTHYQRNQKPKKEVECLNSILDRILSSDAGRSRFVNSMIFFCIFGDLMKGWV